MFLGNYRIHHGDKKTINGLDGNRLLKTYVLLMEDKMEAEAFGYARNYA